MADYFADNIRYLEHLDVWQDYLVDGYGTPPAKVPRDSEFGFERRMLNALR